MQRGIITFNKEQSAIAIKLAKLSTQDLSVLVSKLYLAVNSLEDLSTIEVNREEIEALLDALSVPSETDKASYKSLRSNLISFLS